MSAATSLLRKVRAVGRVVASPFRRAAAWSLGPLRRRFATVAALSERTAALHRRIHTGASSSPRTTGLVTAVAGFLAMLRKGAPSDDGRGLRPEPGPRRPFGRRKAFNNGEMQGVSVPPRAAGPEPSPAPISERDRNRATGLRDEDLAFCLAGISAEADRIAVAAIRRAYLGRGGWNDHRIQVVQMVRDVGLDTAVDLSRHCAGVLEMDGLDYLLRPADTAQSGQLLLVMESRGWLRRRGQRDAGQDR